MKIIVVSSSEEIDFHHVTAEWKSPLRLEGEGRG